MTGKRSGGQRRYEIEGAREGLSEDGMVWDEYLKVHGCESRSGKARSGGNSKSDAVLTQRTAISCNIGFL